MTARVFKALTSPTQMDPVNELLASKHMTNHCDWIINFIPKESKVTIADGSYVMSTGTGNVSLKVCIGGNPRQMELKNVLYVPDFKNSLLSISATTTLGNEVSFKEDWQSLHYSWQECHCRGCQD